MWSGRFREPLDVQFEQWQRSFPFDRRLLCEEVAASKAHALALADAGVLRADELERLHTALDAVAAGATTPGIAGSYPIGASNAAEIEAYNAEAEDIHHFVERELVKHVGDLGLKLHTGRSRNEQIATDLRLYIRAHIGTLVSLLSTWAAALVEQAKQAEEAVMPSYTHLQRAEPVLVAHWLLAYVEMLLRDTERLEQCAARLNYCPLGSGAVAGATLALDRTIAARELNFTSPTANSIDATSDRDFVLEYLQVLTILGVHMSRFAEEMTLFATAEFGFVDLPEAFSTGSSAMPQKKNPDLTELVRAKVGRLAGAAQRVLLTVKGLPLAYNKDMQETQEPVFEATETAEQAVAVLAKFTCALRFRTTRMREACEHGYLNAMAAATYLTGKGLPFRTAHERVGAAVRFGLESGRELGELKLNELRAIEPLFDQDVYAAITLEATLDCHDVLGGTARAQVQRALPAAEARVNDVAGRHSIKKKETPEERQEPAHADT
jgi:argininosuccinate lyase